MIEVNKKQDCCGCTACAAICPKDAIIMKEDKDKIIKEDTTKYGEFVSSYFEWITPDEQRQKAKELEQLGKKDKK